MCNLCFYLILTVAVCRELYFNFLLLSLLGSCLKGGMFGLCGFHFITKLG
ncbi:hypothetical protein Hanom_Chr11g00971181 [Helianthus anomalus]